MTAPDKDAATNGDGTPVPEVRLPDGRPALAMPDRIAYGEVAAGDFRTPPRETQAGG